MEKKLFLLDAYALIYRAYYALIRSPRFTASGFNTSAIFGFCNTLDEVLRKENPTHIAVCFDPSGPTFRHQAFEEYKANREKQPEDISKAVPYIKEILSAKGIPSIEINGYEADDVIGTLSRQAEKEGFITYMMTPDKDFGQLVTDKILMYKPSLRGQDFEIRDVERIKEKYGIESPLQVIDMLALEGDSIDNIPGCPGIGPKTSQKLIQEFGSVENLVNSTDKLKGSVKEKIENNREQIIFSKFLATIKTDVPLDINLDSLIKKEEDIEKLSSIYKELEFRSLLNRLNHKNETKDLSSGENEGIKNDVPRQTNLFEYMSSENETSSFVKIEEIEVLEPKFDDLTGILSEIREGQEVGFILKSVGENAMNAIPTAFALAVSEKKAYYVLFPSELDTYSKDILYSFLKQLFAFQGITVITNDIKRLFVIFHDSGFNFKCTFFDLSLAQYLIDPESRQYIPELAYNYLNYKSVEYDIEPRYRKTMDKWDGAYTYKVLPESACLALRLKQPLSRNMTELRLDDVYYKIELPLASVLAKMEITGVRIDVNELASLSRIYTSELNAMETEAYEIAGQKFNVGSPSQVGEILFEKLAIDPKAKRTKKGSYSTTEENLEKYKNQYPIVDLILKIRQLRKLLATYIDALPLMVDPVTGKIHTTYNQTVTTTGRLSSTNPNLQNIPVRGSQGKEIRRAFIADPDCLFMSADYSQIELRLMADFSKDPHMLQAFRNNVDIHQDTASRVFHKPLDKVTEDDRRNAKTANFGIIYGISPFGLSERLGIPRTEAKQFIEDYMATYPAIRNYISNIIDKARAQGYVTTFTGRRRYLREINSANSVVRGYGERNAVNAPLQGSAADIIKIAMVAIQKRIEEQNLRSTMIMQVHDELIFNVYPDELPLMQQLVSEEMEKAYIGDVSLTTSIGVGKNWLEAH